MTGPPRLALLLAVGLVTLASSTARVLVLVDDANLRLTHAALLAEMGASADVVDAQDAAVTLVVNGARRYDTVVLLLPNARELGGQLRNIAAVSQFVDLGGNVLVAGGGAAVAAIAPAFGYELDEPETVVLDFHHHADDDPTLVTSSHIVRAPTMTGLPDDRPVLFRGMALISDPHNKLALEVIIASSTAYSYDPAESVRADFYPLAVGKQVVLVGAMQARNNARVVLCGSVDFFSDAFLARSDFANGRVATALVGWLLHRTGALRVAKPARHYRWDIAQASQAYAVGQQVVYEIGLEEMVEDMWIPFQGRDVQLELVRVQPMIRTTLQPSEDGLLSASFRVPDLPGVYKFRVEYRRLGYSFIEAQQQVTVRPRMSSEQQRFEPAAYPFFAGAISMMFGVFVFSFVFLHHRDTKLKFHKND